MLIKLWDWEKKWTCTQVFEGHTHYVMQIVINPKDNNTFASASLDRSVKVIFHVNTIMLVKCQNSLCPYILYHVALTFHRCEVNNKNNHVNVYYFHSLQSNHGRLSFWLPSGVFSQ